MCTIALIKLYHYHRGIVEDSIHLLGPERVCVKPQHSTTMDHHIDCDPTLQFQGIETRKFTSPTHPLTHPRIQSVCCLLLDPKEENNGRTEVLSGYHQYFQLGARYFKPYIKPSSMSDYSTFLPVVLKDVFAEHLASFKEYVKHLYDNKKKLLPLEQTPLGKEIKEKKKKIGRRKK